MRKMFQGAMTLPEDQEAITHWSKVNGCGHCRLGPCMCDAVRADSAKRMPQKLVGRSTPPDRPNGLLIRARTVAHLIRCATEVHGFAKAYKNTNTAENWGDMWDEAHRVSIGSISPFGGGGEPIIKIDNKEQHRRYS